MAGLSHGTDQFRETFIAAFDPLRPSRPIDQEKLENINPRITALRAIDVPKIKQV